ncbi:MAG: Eco57I restriction-modification methylase domain-containing protein [Promethearchaeia archaeon]
MCANEQHKRSQVSIGQIFTPAYIAEFMVKNLIGFYESEKESFPLSRKISEAHILEPAAGGGIFLKYLLGNNFQHITAYELDSRLQEELRQKFPQVHFKFKNFLGAPLNEKYDMIIGNPPYLGQNYNADLFQEYKKKFSICEKYFVGNMDIFYYFIHLAIEKLKPGGLLSFITTNYWITKSKKTGIKYLKPHILDKCLLLQYIDLSNLQIFPDAQGQHNCIFVLQKQSVKKSPRKSKKINIISINKTNRSTKTVFHSLLNDKNLPSINQYISATKNKDLQPAESWSLLYPSKVKDIVQKIYNYCRHDGEIKYLKDFFLIRNGLIFISDEIFVLKEGKKIRIEDGQFFIKIRDSFEKLNKKERQRIKKLYKSKEIVSYGHQSSKCPKFAIYFNKNEFKGISGEKLSREIQKKYPTLHKYLTQYEDTLKKTLLNAKENPEDLFFPRRGAFVRVKNSKDTSQLLDLESYYDSHKKIFFKYILDTNEFGFSSQQYYATSDTYFIWKKFPELEIDYFLLIAYLNSKILRFLFKAKNVKIKRSKTKLESSIPIPSFILKRFMKKPKDSTQLIIMNAIRKFSELIPTLIRQSNQKSSANLDFQKELKSIARSLKKRGILKEGLRIEKTGGSLSCDELKRAIDQLFFKLFQIDERQLDKLMRKYY